MATNDSDWGIQLSIKHGPLDDRGNPLYMTNVRGYTATEILDHVKHLAEHGSQITEQCNAYAALQTVQNQFETERAYQPQQGQGGDLCAHGMPRKFNSGFKNGKKWAGMFCPLPKEQNPCAPKWVD